MKYTHIHTCTYTTLLMYMQCVLVVLFYIEQNIILQIFVYEYDVLVYIILNIYICDSYIYIGDFWFKWINCVHHYCTSLRYLKRIFKQEKYDTYVIIISSAPSHPHNNRHYHTARTCIQIHTANKSLGWKKNILSFSIRISGTLAYPLDS